MPFEYRDADHIVSELQRKSARINGWFAHREESLELIVQQAVGGNTFRAFQNMPRRPSEVFRDWALRTLTDSHTTGQLFGVRSQAAYDKWHQGVCTLFREEWQDQMKNRLPYGPSRKLPDLLLKAFVRCSHLSDNQRNRLIAYLHVSLDSLSLVGIRNCIDDPEIPANATMAFVAGQTMYRQIQEVIRSIAYRANVPAVHYDVLVWDLRRKSAVS